jgi:hypothetical protein
MRPRVWLKVVGFLILALGLQSARAGAQFVPAGTVVNIRTIQEVFADTSTPGMRVRALVDYPIAAGNRVIVPQGAPAMLEVTDVTRSSNMQGRDRVGFRLLWVQGLGSVATNQLLFRGPSEGKKARNKILGGAGLGALAGGIFGGGTGAAIGAATGGATGAIMSGSGKEHLLIAPETPMQFQLTAPVQVR